LLNNWCHHLFCNNRCSSFLCDDWSSHFLCHSLLVSFFDKIGMLLMDELLLCLMNHRYVLLMNVLLVDDWLDMFSDDWFVMFVNHILVDFLDDVLVMFMNYFFVGISNNWLLNNLFYNRCFLMSQYLGSAHISLDNRSFFMSDHSWSFHCSCIKSLSSQGTCLHSLNWHCCSHDRCSSFHKSRLRRASLNMDLTLMDYFCILLVR